MGTMQLNSKAPAELAGPLTPRGAQAQPGPAESSGPDKGLLRCSAEKQRCFRSELQANFQNTVERSSKMQRLRARCLESKHHKKAQNRYLRWLELWVCYTYGKFCLWARRGDFCIKSRRPKRLCNKPILKRAPVVPHPRNLHTLGRKRGRFNV